MDGNKNRKRNIKNKIVNKNNKIFNKYVIYL